MSMTPKEICELAAHGNPDAERFCVAWAKFCHLIDDVADKDQPVTDDRLAEDLIGFLAATVDNRFVRSNGSALTSLMVQSANAWLDSNRRQGAERDILKGMWHEVIFHVAWLTGGWKHLRHVTGLAREYQYEKEEVTNGNV